MFFSTFGCIMKRIFIIAVLTTFAAMAANAQLLTDTDRKLRTAKADKQERKGGLFRSKKTSASGDNAKTEKETVTPSYSSGSPFKGEKYTINTYNSAPNPFRGKKYKIPELSATGKQAKGKSDRPEPRFSATNPFRGRTYDIPNLSATGNPFRGSDYDVQVRYSSGSPFRGRTYDIPNLSATGNPFRGSDYDVDVRYSSGSPFRAQDYKANPRFTGTKVSALSGKDKEKYIYNTAITLYYRGTYSLKHKKIGDQHPSANYTSARVYKSEKVRESLRKWNVFWTRLNRNKMEPKGVRKTEKEAKFDKKERVIWNE